MKEEVEEKVKVDSEWCKQKNLGEKDYPIRETIEGKLVVRYLTVRSIPAYQVEALRSECEYQDEEGDMQIDLRKYDRRLVEATTDLSLQDIDNIRHNKDSGVWMQITLAVLKQNSLATLGAKEREHQKNLEDEIPRTSS